MTVLFVFQDGFARIYLDDDKLPCIGKKKKFHSDVLFGYQWEHL